MSDILDLIKSNGAPSSVMRTAARGALSVPPAKMLEVLVYLTQNPVFGHDARMTLASWDENSAAPILAQSDTSPEVLGYFWSEENRRASLMPALIENPAISENLLMELAADASRQIIGIMLASARVRNSPAVIAALETNAHITPADLEELKAAAANTAAVPAAADHAAEAPAADPEADAAHHAWQQEHAAEIAAEEGKPFEFTGKEEDLAPEHSASPQQTSEASIETSREEAAPAPNAGPAPAEPSGSQPPIEGSAASAESLAAAAMASSEKTRPKPVIDERKLSALQKVARMTAAERVKCAFTGNKEERSILIRDGARVVQNAVLASPKLTDPEVETFAASKNLSDNVMRQITHNRRFMKNYHVVRNLVNNPKCPLDIALGLVKNLLVFDLKSLRANKNVPEVIRQVAQKLYKEKTGPAKEIKRG